jgi:hypothetical protein
MADAPEDNLDLDLNLDDLLADAPSQSGAQLAAFYGQLSTGQTGAGDAKTGETSSAKSTDGEPEIMYVAAPARCRTSLHERACLFAARGTAPTWTASILTLTYVSRRSACFSCALSPSGWQQYVGNLLKNYGI